LLRTILTVVVAVEGPSERLIARDDRVKVKGASLIVSVSGAIRSARPKATPRTTRLEYVPGTALPATDSQSCVALPETGLSGDKWATTPWGRCSTLRVTAAVKLVRRLFTMVPLPDDPCALPMLGADTTME
jgi:hypothetical protein